jgi:hypothetical protein
METLTKGSKAYFYILKVRYKDGTGATWSKLSRTKCAQLTTRLFSTQYDRPESIEVTTERGA